MGFACFDSDLLSCSCMGTDLSSIFFKFGPGWDYFLFFWRSHTGRSNAGNTRLEYLVTNILNLSYSTFSVLVWRKWAEKSIWETLNTEKWLGFFWIFLFFIISLLLYRLFQQHYSWPLTTSSWAFKTTHILNFLYTLAFFYHLWNVLDNPLSAVGNTHQNACLQNDLCLCKWAVDEYFIDL